MPQRRARRAELPPPEVARGGGPRGAWRRPSVLVSALVCLAATAVWQPRVAAVLAAVASVLSASAALRRLLAGHAGTDEPAPTEVHAPPRTVRVEVEVARPGGDAPADVVPVTVQVELPTPREPVGVAEDAQPP